MEKNENTVNQPKITIEDLARKVKEMRQAQRNYFKTRAPKYLDRSKEMEREVDGITEEILNPQISLFDGI